MGALPYYTKNTDSLSDETKEIRSSFYFAKTPQDFLNKELPSIFKLNLANVKKQSDLDDFERRLTDSFNELKNCYSNMLIHFHELSSREVFRFKIKSFSNEKGIDWSI